MVLFPWPWVAFGLDTGRRNSVAVHSHVLADLDGAFWELPPSLIFGSCFFSVLVWVFLVPQDLQVGNSAERMIKPGEGCQGT